MLARCPKFPWGCFRVEWPIRTFEKTSLTLSNKGHLSNMTSKAIVLLKGKTWAVEHIIKAVAIHDFELSLTATTPVPTWEKTALTITNKGALKDMAAKATLLLNGKTWAIDTTCRLVMAKPMAKI